MARFEKGLSGNPAGKPKGASDKRTALRDLLAPHAEELVSKAVEMALKGDTTALRICIDRIIPSVKATDCPIRIDNLAGPLVNQGQVILEAVSAGAITPDEAVALMQIVMAQARIIETTELEKRIGALEAIRNGKKIRGSKDKTL